MKTSHTIRSMLLLTGGACVLCISDGALAGEASFTPLGYLNPFQPYSSAWGVSADGQTVAATSFNDGNRAVRWTPDAGMFDLGLLPSPPAPPPSATASAAGFISHDGSVIVGRTLIGCCTTMSTRWAAPDWEPEYLGPNLHPDNDWGDHTLGISGDGQVIVGQSSTGLADTGAWHPYRWTLADGMVSLVPEQQAETIFGSAHAASYDGSAIVGWYRPAGLGFQHAYRWTESTGIVHLGALGFGHGEATAITPDGSIVVGNSSVGAAGRTPFRWTESEGMVSLGQWVYQGEPRNTVPMAVNADASVIVGYGMIFMGTCPQCWWHHEAVIWDAANGWRHLIDVLEDEYDLWLFGWTLNEARDISPDGRFIVGGGTDPLGNTEAWLVELPAPPAPKCPADLTGNGAVGVPDLLQLLAAWGPCPAPCPADLTNSGSVGVPDLLQLLAAWGPCP